jgi:predicted GIY-YIG superfamily endonuclease
MVISIAPGVKVREQIFKYLLGAGRGVAAAQILSDVLKIHSPKAHSSDSVLAGFLGDDPRFVFAEGLWHLSSFSQEPIRFDIGKTVVLHLQSANRSETLRGIRGALMWADGRLQEFTTPASINDFGRLRSETEDHLLIVWSSRELGLWNGLLRSQSLEAWRGDRLYLRDLAARALKRMPSKLQPDELASELGLSPADEARPRDVARNLNACWLLLLDRIPAESCRNLDSLRDWIGGPGIDFSHFAFGPNFLRQLPSTSGVYLMRDREDTVIYVGKSRNLKRRVSSYFTPCALYRPKIARIHERLHSIDVRRTENEIEALLIEMRMIREFRPAINLQTEIHEGQADRHQGRNLLLFVVGAEQKGVKIYFLCNGIFAGRHAASLGGSPSKRLQAKLKSLFFTQGKRRKRRSEAWEKEIVSRWFTANRKRLNYLDVNEVGNFASLLERLRDYLCDPDRLTCRVYYRGSLLG